MAQFSDAQPAAIADLIPDLDRLAVDAMADWKVPGAAIAVVQDGKVALTKSYGQRDVEANLPVTAATRFAICSITKSFTATGVALLHNEGRLDWTKPVRDYLPEFRLHDPVATERLTIRDLLSHQSGLPRHDWVHFAGDRAPAELLGLMRHLELSRDIRAAWQYNNLCYNAVGLLIERVSGQSYQSFIRARLTDRLGMTVGFTLDDLEASADAPRPYMMHEETRLPAMRLPIRTPASGAINTSVADLANWMRLHLGKGEFNGERLAAGCADRRAACAARLREPVGIRRVRRSALWPRLSMSKLSRRPGGFSWRRLARLGRADDPPARFRHRGRGLDQSQPERSAGNADLVHHRPAARSRAGRLARAPAQAVGNRPLRKCRPTRTRARRSVTPIRNRHTTLRPMRATTSIRPTA